MDKKTVAHVVKSPIFKLIASVLGVIFLILTFFITLAPDTFSGYGYLGIFLFNIFNTSILIMPLLLERFDLWGIVFFSALGNIPNTSVNYLVGDTSKRLFPHSSVITLLKKWMHTRYGLLVVYLIAIIPLPIDINGLLAGYVGIPFYQYIIVNFLGRATSFLLAGLGVWTFAQAMGW